jgi:hypothetical protein
VVANFPGIADSSDCEKRPQDMTRVAEVISMNSSKMIKTNKQKTNNERKKINISVAIFLVLHDPVFV